MGSACVGMSSAAPAHHGLATDRSDAPAAATYAPSRPAGGQVSDPVRLRVPDIDVDAAVIPLGLQPDGALEVPQDFSETGWYTAGPEPGEPGSAVIAGHVDSKRGPAVFFRLQELRPGAIVEVAGEDGSTMRFSVDRIERHPKDRFPTDMVYGPTDEVALRLITCGGTFDRSSGHYRDNVIVFATAV
jgi:sortase (surface protein transpeptidase)